MDWHSTPASGGEQLCVLISARNTLSGIMAGIDLYDGRTEGAITIHTGGSGAYYLTPSWHLRSAGHAEPTKPVELRIIP